MSRTADPVAVRRAKADLRARFQHRGWFRGVGVVPAKNGLALRLNVAPDADTENLPREIDGIPIEIVRIAAYVPR